MRKKLWLVLTLTLSSGLVLGQSSDKPDPQPLPIISGCTAIQVASIPASAGRVTSRPKFSAQRISNATFLVLFPASEKFEYGEMLVKVLTPKGHLYQEVTVPLKRDSEAPAEVKRQVPGYPYPLEIRSAKLTTSTQGTNRVVSVPPLLVGGTQISRNGLFGVWKVEAWPENTNKPCSAEFEITP